MGDLSGKNIVFTIGSQSASAVTDASGVATTALVLEQIPNMYSLEVRFDGDAYYLPSAHPDTFDILKENTVVSSPNETVTYGREVTITVDLLDDDGSTLLHQADEPKTVYLEFSDGSNWLLLAQDILPSPDNSDYELDFTFLCSGPDFPVPPFDDGEHRIRARFEGDIRYNGDIEEGTLTILNAPPVADAGADQAADEGEVITFNGSGSYDIDTNPTDGIPYLVYDWDFDDGSTANGVGPTHAYGDNDPENDGYKVILTITDDDGATARDDLVITVNNVAPTVTIDLVEQPNPHFILPYQRLTFTGSFTDPGWLDTHTDAWDFGNGIILSGTLAEENDAPDSTGTSVIEYAYPEPGTYSATLTITDDDGGAGTSQPYSVTVMNPEEVIWLLDEYIQNLPDEAFKKPAQNRKNTLHNKLMAILRMVSDGKYEKAISKLEHDIRSKADGSVDGHPGNDWIIDPAAQQDICQMIDDITAYFQMLADLNAAPPRIEDKKGKIASNLSASYRFEALNAYPQPFNPDVWIPYTLGKGVKVNITIYNAAGQVVRILDLGYQDAGAYMSKNKAAYWDGTNDAGEHVSSGVYFYAVRMGDFTAMRKLVMLK